MKKELLSLGETGTFSPIFLDYLKQDQKLKSFYDRFPEIQQFEEQIKNKNFAVSKRKTLYNVLQKQYNDLPQSANLARNIELLQKDNTYTITTGHQLNIFTGPLYFIYKIVTVINACKALKEKYPSYNFVPVYWMASEDHDFEEISYFNLFGKKHQWKTEQKGAVGRFPPAELKEVMDEVGEVPALFEKAYLRQETLADAVRDYVNELFGKEGAVVIDADNKDLKAEFKEVIKEDLLLHSAHTLVEASSIQLADSGYKGQIFPRPINFFYLHDDVRERFVQEGEAFRVNNTDLVFSREEIIQLLEEHPERFSPNVVMRPLYQETILPNLAYVGGPAEVAYWLQLKAAFTHFDLPLPMLMPRNFALVINKTMLKKIDKLNIDVKDLFLETSLLKKKFVEDNSENSLSLEAEMKALEKVYDLIREKGIAIDKSLEGFIGAESSKALKGVGNIEKRLKKGEEKKQETALKQVEGLKEKLFPGGGLQERVDNFLNFYINQPSFLEDLLHTLDPFDFNFHILKEDE